MAPDSSSDPDADYVRGGVQYPEVQNHTCIKSILHGPAFVRSYINDLVVATSELEARGSLIYTLALLRCSEDHDIVPNEMFQQGFMTRCIGVARSSTAKVEYAPNELCQRYLFEACEHVPAVTGYDFKHFNQLINQLGRRMKTVVMTNLSAHMQKRQARAVQTFVVQNFPPMSKSKCSFVTKHVLWRISDAPESSYRKPNPTLYKDPGSDLLQEPILEQLVNQHRKFLQGVEESYRDPDDGIVNERPPSLTYSSGIRYSCTNLWKGLYTKRLFSWYHSSP